MRQHELYCEVTELNPDTKEIIQLANTFIGTALAENKTITGRKLNLLIYLFSREYYKMTGTFLFNEKFRCGEKGPYLETLIIFFEYDLPSLPIPTASYLIGDSMEYDAEKISLNSTTPLTTAFYKVWYEYRNMASVMIEHFLRNSGTAWRKAKEEHSDELSSNDIEEEIRQELNEEIKAFEVMMIKRKHQD